MRTFKGLSNQDRSPTSNVVPIRPGGGVASNDDDSGVAKAKWIAGATAKGLGSVLRSLSFLIMLWLRLPVRLLLIATSAMAFIGVVLCLVIFSDRSMVPGFIIIGVRLENGKYPTLRQLSRQFGISKVQGQSWEKSQQVNYSLKY